MTAKRLSCKNTGGSNEKPKKAREALSFQQKLQVLKEWKIMSMAEVQENES